MTKYRECDCGFKNYELGSSKCGKCGRNILSKPIKIEDKTLFDLNNIERPNKLSKHYKYINRDDIYYHVEGYTYGKNGFTRDLVKAFEILKDYVRDHFEEDKAIAELASRYLDGVGVEKNKAEAVRLYKILAERGNSSVEVLLGYIYESDDFADKDLSTAIEWHERAAKKNDKQAVSALVRLYKENINIPNANQELYRWLEIGVQMKDPILIFEMAELYVNGKYTEPQYSKAFYYYNLVISESRHESYYKISSHEKLGNMYFNGLGVRQSLENAFEHYLLAANKGFEQSILKVAQMYEDGKGVTKDIGKSIDYYKKAADFGNAEAQKKLGFIYWNGAYGREKNTTEALIWYQKACDLNDIDACNELGYIYYEFGRTDKEVNYALDLFEKAAERGSIAAQLSLGNIYKDGKRVIKNFNEAVKWYTMAAEKDNSDAQCELAIIYGNDEFDNKNIEKSNSLFEKAAINGNVRSQKNRAYHSLKNKDYTKLFYWDSKLAENNDPDSLLNLHSYYLQGIGTEKNVPKAIEYLERAVSLNQMIAIHTMARYCYEGTYLPINYEKSFIYHKSYSDFSSSQGEAELPFSKISYGELAEMYYYGRGTSIDYMEALKWATMAIERGYNQIKNIAAMIYYLGLAGKKDLGNAIKLFEESAMDGNASSQFYIGKIYYNGEGVKKNETKGLEWLRKSSQRGEKLAIDFIDKTVSKRKWYHNIRF